MSFLSRNVIKAIVANPQAEGKGAVVRRSIGNQLRQFDPFLMLDEFSIKYPSGFPSHPHRGFETVTYLLRGTCTHEDFAGHKGVIRAGGLQWMTAGRGIVHSEMPGREDESYGLQLWVNLKSSQKMCEPEYQELSDVPSVEKDGVSARVISGKAMGIESPIRTKTPVYYTHFKMEPGKTLRHEFPVGWNAFIFTLEGKAQFGGKSYDAHQTLILSQEGNGIEVQSESNCSFVCIAGQPIGEPVVQYGPFVMNTEQEIRQAMVDYQQGKNGFERSRTWKSESYGDEE